MSEGWATVRLTVSPMVVDDAADLHVALSPEAVGRYLGGPDVGSASELVERIEYLLAGPADGHQDWLNFTGRLQDGTVIGRLEATIEPGDDAWAEVAWVFGPQWWGQGYGTEAAVWLSQHLEEAWGVRELWGTVHPENAASIGLLRRLGMSLQEEPYDRHPGSLAPGDLVFARVP